MGAGAAAEGQMTAKRWLFTVDGQPRYYQEGEYIYSKDGKPEFWISDGWWYATNGGQPEKTLDTLERASS
jgi:hypothetical protein